jgi:hypothetical protein
VTVRCAAGRRFAWLGIVCWIFGELIAESSNGEGDFSSLVGVAGSAAGVGGVVLLFISGSGRGDCGTSSLLLWILELLAWRLGLCGMLRLLLGLANGLDGRSGVPLI